MIVVSDTSPITNLLRIGRVNLLRDLFETVVIPEAVYSEVSFLENQRREVASFDWIQIVRLANRRLFDTLMETLDRGEAEAIALSVELSADVRLIDETVGRSEAEKLGLEVTGLIGILIIAKEKSLIELLEPELKKLVSDAGFWLSPQLIEAVLVSVHER